jgi:hypothetical protein
MTEEEWLACEDLKKMMEFAGLRCSNRRLQLFAAGCCMRFWDFLGQSVQEAVIAAEKHADGLLKDEDLEVISQKATQHFESRKQEFEPSQKWSLDYELAGPAVAIYITSRQANLLTYLTECTRRLSAAIASSRTASESSSKKNHKLIKRNADHAALVEMETQISLLRDIFPFHPITLSPSWLTSTVVYLANQMYESRDFSAMPILADALQDASCDNPQILEHCRGPGPHVRGCFVLDACLGKS